MNTRLFRFPLQSRKFLILHLFRARSWWWYIVLGESLTKLYFQLGALSEILTIANLRHILSRIRTYAEQEFRLCWMKLCWSATATPYFHYTTTNVNFYIFEITTRKQAITIQILSSILINEGKQTIIFGQLIKYNVRNIFFKKSYGNEASSTPVFLFMFFLFLIYSPGLQSTIK